MDELEEYLAAPPSALSPDPILYWSGHRDNGSALAGMALDYLSTPGQSCSFSLRVIFIIIYKATSTDVERAFSRGRLTVSRMRHSLSDESTRAATVLSSWMAVPGIVPESDIIQALRTKTSRTGNTKGKEVEGVAAAHRDGMVVGSSA